MLGRLFPLFAAVLLTSTIELSSCGGGDEGSGSVRNDAGPTEILPMPPNGPIAFGDSLPPPDAGEFPPPAHGDSPDAPRCDPNYEPCVPIDSDVDCAGGSGNGPSYVRGPVRVVGRDPYGLDGNHDGVGCEN